MTSTCDIFNGATNASRKMMWQREFAQQQQTSAREETPRLMLQLRTGEKVHDISTLYAKRCRKDEERKAHRFMRSSSITARSPTSSPSGRHAIDPRMALTQRLNGVPDAVYDTEGGAKSTLQRDLQEGPNNCISAFHSTTDRFASTAAYRSSTFASVVKEPFSNPAAVGPGTYHTKKRAIEVKHKLVPTPSYISKSARFGDSTSTSVTDQSMASSPVRPCGEIQGARSCSPSKVKGPLISPTPRFKSALFPERYVSSKQHQLTHDAPDRFYDVSPACKFTVQSAVHSSTFQCSAMRSRSSRVSSEAAMVHNTPNVPILTSSTNGHVGPGAYEQAARPKRFALQEDKNYIMLPHNVDRFGLPGPNVAFVEARFRRFAVRSTPSSPRAAISTASPRQRHLRSS